MKDLTVFIRPDGDGKPGTEVNWDGKKNTSHMNLPWLAMSFVVGGKRYTAATSTSRRTRKRRASASGPTGGSARTS